MTIEHSEDTKIRYLRYASSCLVWAQSVPVPGSLDHPNKALEENQAALKIGICLLLVE